MKKRRSARTGLTVFSCQEPVPKVHVSFATLAGSADDPAGKAGLASLSVEVMKRGVHLDVEGRPMANQ